MSNVLLLLRRLAICAAILLSVLQSVVRCAEATPHPCGICFVFDEESGELRLIPLESTEVVMNVKPGLLEAEVVQTFSNRGETALEAIYRYPLPDGATLTHFELRYDDRVVSSIVREKQAARVDYEAAKTAGKKAALLEQHDPMLFSTSVANFLPGETVHVALRFIQPLDLRADAVEVRFPMVTADRYFPAGSIPGTPGNSAPNPQRLPFGGISEQHVYAFDVEVAGIPATAVTSASHRIQVDQASDGRLLVALAEDVTVPDRDFVLRIETTPGHVLQPTLVTQHTSTGDYGLLTVFPPMRADSGAAAQPRDIFFLLDRSGSMDGARFRSARRGLERCIELLQPRDRFHIAVFSNTCEFFRPNWTVADAGGRRAGIEHVRGLRVEGGTELQAALAQCLATFEENGRTQILIVLTDGDVGNADSLLNLVEQRIGRARLFPFGIGQAPNAHLVNRVAEIGRGQARFIADDAAIERELTDLFTTLDAPVLSDVRLGLLDAAGNPQQHYAFPQHLADVFVGRPIQTVFRTVDGAPARVVIEGSEAGRPFRLELPVQTAVLRGDGLEKQFGRRWFDDLGTMLRRATTENEQALVREEMLETALQFQLVTELTSRVAIEKRISRDPNGPLVTQEVGQASPADQFVGMEAEAEVIELSAFEVSCAADTGYHATNTLAGSRVQSSLRDVASALTVVTQEFLQDIAPTALEDVLPFTMEPENDPTLARSGTDTGLLDGLPIATVVDPATVARIELQSAGPAWTNIQQHRSVPNARTSLTVRAGDEGFGAATLESCIRLDPDLASSLLGLLSWTRFGHDQWTAFLTGSHALDETRFRGSLQLRDLGGYGRTRMARAGLDGRTGPWFFNVDAAWHRLDRDDPDQFRLASPTARYEGLGFFNLDLLTAETSRLEDAVAQVIAGRDARTALGRHVGYLRGRWHHRSADWSTPAAGTTESARRVDMTFDSRLQIELADGRFKVDAHLGWSAHRAEGETDEDQTTRTAGLILGWHPGGPASVFANWTHGEVLPWVPTGRWRMDNNDLRRVSHRVEERAGGQLGLRVELMNKRLSAMACAFHDEARNLAFRDWAWEQDHNGAGSEWIAEDTLRLPVGYSLGDRFTREGWMGSVDFTPTRAFTATASWYHDWKDEGPIRGGNRRASLATRYTWTSGLLKGLSSGLAVSHRNTMTFNDGYALEGGVRWDLFSGYRWRDSAGNPTVVQLNLANLTGRDWQPTRFAPDRGRQFVFTVSRYF